MQPLMSRLLEWRKRVKCSPAHGCREPSRMTPFTPAGNCCAKSHRGEGAEEERAALLQTGVASFSLPTVLSPHDETPGRAGDRRRPGRGDHRLVAGAGRLV